MPRGIDYETLKNRHGVMLRYQDEISPFTPTMRELGHIWGIRTTSHTSYVLNNMLKNGMVITRKVGNRKKVYYAVEQE
mgnify:CR=1 FL=1